jgi:hypothetical protein
MPVVFHFVVYFGLCKNVVGLPAQGSGGAGHGAPLQTDDSCLFIVFWSIAGKERRAAADHALLMCGNAPGTRCGGVTGGVLRLDGLSHANLTNPGGNLIDVCIVQSTLQPCSSWTSG